MPETPNGLPYPPGTGVPPDVPYWMQQLAEALDPSVADTNWQSLTWGSGWIDHAGRPPFVRRVGRLVMLRGQGAGTTGTPMVTLGVGYRPAASFIIPCASATYSYLTVSPSGTVTPSAGSSWWSLASVQFFTDDPFPS